MYEKNFDKDIVITGISDTEIGKRATMNNFFTTLFAAMISAIVALVGIVDVSAFVMLFGSVLGVALCFLWRSTIQV